MSDLVERLEYCKDQRDRWRKKALELEADHERAVAMVIEASIPTGHAETSADLMAEVLHVVKNLRTEVKRRREINLDLNMECNMLFRKLSEKKNES